MQFVMVGSVVGPYRLRDLGCLLEARMQIVGDDRQMYGFPVDAAGHHSFEGLPVCWCAERQPVGVAR